MAIVLKKWVDCLSAEQIHTFLFRIVGLVEHKHDFHVHVDEMCEQVLAEIQTGVGINATK